MSREWSIGFRTLRNLGTVVVDLIGRWQQGRQDLRDRHYTLKPPPLFIHPIPRAAGREAIGILLDSAMGVFHEWESGRIGGEVPTLRSAARMENSWLPPEHVTGEELHDTDAIFIVVENFIDQMCRTADHVLANTEGVVRLCGRLEDKPHVLEAQGDCMFCDWTVEQLLPRRGNENQASPTWAQWPRHSKSA